MGGGEGCVEEVPANESFIKKCRSARSGVGGGSRSLFELGGVAVWGDGSRLAQAVVQTLMLVNFVAHTVDASTNIFLEGGRSCRPCGPISQCARSALPRNTNYIPRFFCGNFTPGNITP